MLTKVSVWAVWMCIGAGFGACAHAAEARTTCSNAGDVSVCHGPLGGSVMHRIGDLTLVTWQDGGTTTMTRQGDFSVVIDSREGMSGTGHHFGDITIFNLEVATVVCMTTGPTTLCG